MKDIGRTNEGNFLVELTEDEHRAFGLLSQTISGGTVWSGALKRNAIQDGVDLSNAFGAVLSFATHKAKVNELRELIEDLDRALMKKESGGQ